MERRVWEKLNTLKKNRKIFDDIDVIFDADMSLYTSFKAGGKAAALAIVESEDALKAVLMLMDEEKTPHMILGNGSNTLFLDSGYEGVVIKPGEGFSRITLENETNVRAGASVLMSVLAKELLGHSLTGFEFAGGIPGSLGGALFMNAGAYGGEMKDIVAEAELLSPCGKNKIIVSGDDMDFSYRHSRLQEDGYIVLSVLLKLEKGNQSEISDKMKDFTQRRNSKQPVNYPSAGSTFKRPEGYFAGKLVEDAGLKGLTVGGAQVSTLHSGFIINRGGASASDIMQLITLVQNTVYDKFGVMLEPEVRIIG